MEKLRPLTGAFTLGMAVLSIPALALAQATLVELGNTGQLVNDGASAVIPVEVACTDETTFANINIGFTQRVGTEFIRGDRGMEVENCSSTPRTVQVLVTPGGEGQRFREGTVDARATLFACDSSNCNILQDSEEIQLQQ
jgi:hypothetical protein